MLVDIILGILGGILGGWIFGMLARSRNHWIAHRSFYRSGDTRLDYALTKEGVNTSPEKAKRICLAVSNVGEVPPLNTSLTNSTHRSCRTRANEA